MGKRDGRDAFAANLLAGSVLLAGAASLIAGGFALCLAMENDGFAALIALGLSVSWAVTFTLLAACTALGARRAQAEMRKHIAERALDRLVCELRERRDKPESDEDSEGQGAANARERAELIDRIHALASTALGKP